jgi:catechol 2,3-dioxygenase-like lactoylglutathione lyase family enzyme
MPLGGLQHFTIEPADLERSKEFYCDVLGLENGERPPLDFPGYCSIAAASPPCI